MRFDTENRLGSRPVCENRVDSGEVVGKGRVDERESSWKSNLYNWMNLIERTKGGGGSASMKLFFFSFPFLFGGGYKDIMLSILS